MADRDDFESIYADYFPIRKPLAVAPERYTPPTHLVPPKQAELRPAYRPGDAFSAANPDLEQMAAELGDSAYHGDWRNAAVAGAGIASSLAQGKVRQGAKAPRANVYRPSMHDPNQREKQGPGFYSHMLAELKDMERGGRQQGNAAAWLKELQRAQVKPEEIAGSKIDQYLAEQQKLFDQGQRGPITRAELVEYARANQPMIEEIRFGGDPAPDVRAERMSGRLRRDEDGNEYSDYRVRLPDSDREYEMIYDRDAGNYSVRDVETGKWLEVDGPVNRQTAIHAKEAMEKHASGLLQHRQPSDVQGPLKWGGNYGDQDLVLDPSNPKNREYVLGLQPSQRQREIEARLKELEKLQYGYSTKVEPEAKAAYETRGREHEALQKELHGIRTGQYKEGHFPEVADYLGHGRGGEYMTAEGEPVWHVDEIQNTRAQKIRDEGGRDPATDAAMQKRVDDLLAKQKAVMDQSVQFMKKIDPTYEFIGSQLGNAKSISDVMFHVGAGRMARTSGLDDATKAKAGNLHLQIDNLQNEINLAKAEQQAKLQSAPGHPLVDDMSVANRLGIRHALLQTKDKDVSGLTLTPGDLQNERYNLSKFVDYMHFEPWDGGGPDFSSSQPDRKRFGTLYAGRTGGSPEVVRPVETREQLEDFIGKDMAGRVLAQPLTSVGKYSGTTQSRYMHRLDGLSEHEIGGQGMRDYYDRQYPETLNKELKRLDPGYPGQREVDVHYSGDVDGPFSQGAHHFPLTPKAKDEIKEGLPFYNWGVPLGAAAAGAGSWLDPQYGEDADIGFAEGGDIDTEDIINKMRAMAPEAVADTPRLPSDRFYDYSLTDPTREQWQPPRRDPGEIRSRWRPEAPLDRAQKEWVGLGPTLSSAFLLGQQAHSIYDTARQGEWLPAAKELAEVSLPIALGAVVPMAPRGRPRMGIDEYVQGLKNRPTSQHDVVNFDKILDPDQSVPPSIARMATSEPHYQQDKRNLQLRKNQPQALQDATSRTSINNMVRLADDGLYLGHDGRLVNPWYHPGALYDTFIRELGDELGADRFQKFMGYLASTSPMTGVERNTIEALRALHNDINGIPMKELTTSELTGGAYKNKVDMLGSVASGEGLMSKSAPKVRNFWLNLMGAGYTPEYEFANGKAKLIQPPSTLDNIMMQAFGHVDAEGNPKRPVGPPYRVMQDVLHRIAEKFDATDPDTQAAIWQAFQRAKDREKGPYASSGSAYNMPYAGTFNEIINRIGRERDQHPSQVLEDMLTGRAPPPNSFTVKADGGGVLGEWLTVTRPEQPLDLGLDKDLPDRPDLVAEQLEHAPLTYPLSPAGDDWTGLADSVDNRWMNNFAKDDRLAQYDANVADEATPYDQKFDRMMRQVNPIHDMTKHRWAGPGPRESSNASFAPVQPQTLDEMHREIDALTPRASGGDVTTADILPLMHTEANPTLDRGRVPTYLSEEAPAEPHSAWRSAANAYAALGNEWLGRMPSTFGNVLTGRNPSDANAEREDALSYGRRADLPGFRLGTELLDNPGNPTNPQMWLAPFIGGIQAKRLADAKILKAGDKGGPEAFAEAERMFGKEDPRKIYNETGVVHGDTWGRMPDQPYPSRPAAWFDTPELSVNEDALQKMLVNGSAQWRAEGKLPDLMHGLDEAVVAEPALKDVVSYFALNPRSRNAEGMSGANFVWRDNVKRHDSVPIGARPNIMRLEGMDFNELNKLAPHELDHLVGYGANHTPRGKSAQFASALRGTEAEHMIDKRVADLSDEYARLVRERGPENDQTLIVQRLLADAQEKRSQVPGRAAYLAEPTELKAREAYLRHFYPGLSVEMPGTIDTYVPGALGDRLEARLGVPLSAYRPPALTHAEGSLWHPGMSDAAIRSGDKADGGGVEGYEQGGSPIGTGFDPKRKDEIKADGGEVQGYEEGGAPKKQAELKNYDPS